MMSRDTVQELETLPDSARSLTTLAPEAGYIDTFLTPVPVGERSAEAWSRLVLEQAPSSLRVSLPPGWASLGLRHGPLGTPDHVLGWPIRDHTEDYVLLGAGSRLGMPAELLFARWDGSLLFATLIRFDCAAMRALWIGVERTHKHIVRVLLDHAAQNV